MAVLNYTTCIAVVKTVGEIQTMLGAAGASEILIRYTDRRPTAVSFSLRGPRGDHTFNLPVDIGAMEKVLQKQWRGGQIQKRFANPEQAERTAWRVVKDWLAAQLTLVEAQMANLDQVMFPYLVADDGRTVYAHYVDSGRLALESGK